MVVSFNQSCPFGQYTALSTAGQAVKIRSLSGPGRVVVATSLPAAGATNYMHVSARDPLQTIFVGAADIVYYQPMNQYSQAEIVDGLVGAAADFGTGGGGGGGVISAGENHIGAVGGETAYLDFTPVLDTSIYATGDVLFIATTIGNAARVNDKPFIISSCVVIDSDDQGIAMDVFFYNAAITFGTINGAPSVSDSDELNALGHFSIAASDYIDLGGTRQATKTALGIIGKPVSGARNIYAAAIIRGTPTYTASGLKFRFGILQD